MRYSFRSVSPEPLYSVGPFVLRVSGEGALHARDEGYGCLVPDAGGYEDDAGVLAALADLLPEQGLEVSYVGSDEDAAF